MTEESKEVRSLDELGEAFKAGWTARLTRIVKDKSSAPTQPAVPQQLLANLSWKAAAFDTSGKTESVPPDKLPEEIKTYLAKCPKIDADGYTYTYSPKGWLNRKKKK